MQLRLARFELGPVFDLSSVRRNGSSKTCPSWIATALFLVIAWHGARATEPPAPPAPLAFLERLCDDFGGRLTGSAANAGALDALAAELRALGLKPEKVPFTMPGWERGEDHVDLVAPVARPLRIAALSYTQPQAAFEAEVVGIGQGREADYPPASVEGMIGVLDSGTALQAREFVRLAAEHRLRGILFVNREAGGQLLARPGRFTGETVSR